MIYDCIPANISCFPRRLEDVFSVTVFDLTRCLEDVLKTSSRGACKMSSENVFKTSSRRLQDVFKTSSRHTCKTSFTRRLEDVFKTYSRRRFAIMSWRRLEDVLEDKKMLYWRRLQYVFTKTNVYWDVVLTAFFSE